MATPRKRGGDPAMEKLMAEALALEKARTAEQAGLLQMDKEEERRERELQMEARRRYEMDQQRKRHEEEEDRYHELMDQAHEKQLKTTARLKARQKEQAAAVKEKRDKYQAKMDAIAKARSDKLEAEMKKAKDIEQKSSTPRRGQSPRRLGTPGSGRRPGTSPRGTSPRRRVDLGASTDSLASTQRLEMMATRRLEEEKQALMKRAQPKPALWLSCSSFLRSARTTAAADRLWVLSSASRTMAAPCFRSTCDDSISDDRWRASSARRHLARMHRAAGRSSLQSTAGS